MSGIPIPRFPISMIRLLALLALSMHAGAGAAPNCGLAAPPPDADSNPQVLPIPRRA